MKIERNGLTAPDDVAKHIVNAVHVKGGVHELLSIELVEYKGSVRYIVFRAIGTRGVIDFADDRRVIRYLDSAVANESALRALFKASAARAEMALSLAEKRFADVASDESASSDEVEAAKAAVEAAKASAEAIKAKLDPTLAHRTRRYLKYLEFKANSEKGRAEAEAAKAEAGLELVRMMRAGSEESSVGEALIQAASLGPSDDDAAHHRVVPDSEPITEPAPSTDPEPATEPAPEPAVDPEPATDPEPTTEPEPAE